MNVTISRTRHRAAGCPCGHDTHTANGMTAIESVTCPTCSATETAERVTLAFDTIARIGMLAVGEGSLVRYDGQSMRIASIAQVTKLNGKYLTDYVRMKLKELPPA